MEYAEIRKRRKQYNISQTKLAEASAFSKAAISAWERGKSVPSDYELSLLDDALSAIIKDIDECVFDVRKKIHFLLFGNIKRDDSPKAIALFSGCGGLSLGFAAEGFNLVGHVEIEESANKIYNDNFPESRLLGTDICEISDDNMHEWVSDFGSIDVLVGGPPCQGFSLAGKRDPEDVRNQLYKYYVHIVSVLQPKVFVMENVRLLTSMKNSDGHLFIDCILDSFSKSLLLKSLSQTCRSGRQPGVCVCV